MQSPTNSDTRSGDSPVIGRTTILILCGLLFALFFLSTPGTVAAKLALLGGVAGAIGYLGLLFSGRKTQTDNPLAA